MDVDVEVDVDAGVDVDVVVVSAAFDPEHPANAHAAITAAASARVPLARPLIEPSFSRRAADA